MKVFGACLLGVSLSAAALEPVGVEPAVAPQNVEPGAAPEGAQPQVKDDLFAGTEKFAKDASDVTDVNLDRNMLGAVRGHGKDGQIANQLNFIVVHSYTYDKPGMYRMEDVEAYQKKLTSGDWSCFVHVRERKSGEATDICKRNGNEGDNHELVIITAEPKELTFVHLSGKMPFNDMQSLGQLGALGVMMAVPPVPPVPPLPPVPPVPGASAAPPAPKLQKQGQSVSRDVDWQLYQLNKVAWRVWPRLNGVLARAEMQVARAETRGLVGVERAMVPRVPIQMAQLDCNFPQIRAWQLRLDGPEFRDQMQKLHEQMNSPEFREQIEKLNRQMMSPEFREQMRRQMETMQSQLKNPEFQKQMRELNKGEIQKQMQELQKQMNSPEFQKQMQLNQQEIEKQMQQLNEQMQQMKTLPVQP